MIRAQWVLGLAWIYSAPQEPKRSSAMLQEAEQHLSKALRIFVWWRRETVPVFLQDSEKVSGICSRLRCYVIPSHSLLHYAYLCIDIHQYILC
jgi:hypothetical protein